MKSVNVLAEGLCPGVDGHDEGGGLIGLKGGRHNQVLSRLQWEELHHLTCIYERLSLGNGCISAEEWGLKLPALYAVLQQHEDISA